MFLAFDLDGTLIDSARDIAEATNAVLESYGGRALPVEAVVAMIGDGARVLVGRAIAAGGLDVRVDEALVRFFRAYDERLTRHTRPYDGVVEAVAALAAQAPLAVVTNKPEALARRVLGAFDLARHFRWVIGGDGAFARKPDPAGVRHVMTLAGAGAPETIFVGDSAIDLATARAAGVRFCFARYGFGARRGGVDPGGDDLVVDDSRTLAATLGRLLEQGSRV